jgi:hypothetical protein
VRVAPVLVALALLAIPAALAKDIQPGDLRLCGRDRCVPIEDPSLIPRMGSFLWGPARVVHAQRVRPGTRAFKLRFRNGHVWGMVATAKLNRFRAYGFDCRRFEYGEWYRVPPRVAAAWRALTHGVRPLPVPATPPRSC